MSIVHSMNNWPQRPGVIVGAIGRGLRHNLEIDQGFAAVPKRGADTIGTRIATANHDNILVFGTDIGAIVQIRIQ